MSITSPDGTVVLGNTVLAGPGTTVLEDGSSITLALALQAGHVLEIRGTVTSTSTFYQFGAFLAPPDSGGGALLIDAGSTFDLQGGNDFASYSGTDIIRNRGLLQQLDADSFTNIETQLVNTGTIHVGAGGLAFQGALFDRLAGLGINNGVIDVAAGAELDVGGTLFYNAGTVNQRGDMVLGVGSAFQTSFVMQRTGTYNLIGDVSIVPGPTFGFDPFVNFCNNGGVLAKTAGDGVSVVEPEYIGVGGRISVATGTLELRASGNLVQSQAVSGAGTLAVGMGGHLVISGGTTIKTGGLRISGELYDGSRSILGLAEDLSYAGAYEQDGAGLVLGSHTLSLTGSASFTGRPGHYASIEGTGSLVVSNATRISGTNLLGSATLQNTGTVTQTGNVGVGDPTNGAARIINATGAVWTIADDALIAGDSVQAAFVNDGTLVVTAGQGLSVIRPAVTSSLHGAGHIEVASGSLELVRGLSGHETLQIDPGSTLILDADASAETTVAFEGSGSHLQLNDAAGDHGTIVNFSGADTLDLRSVAFTGQSPIYHDTSTLSGTLNLGDGTHAASLAMLGSFKSSSFHASGDGHGGTLITLA